METGKASKKTASNTWTIKEKKKAMGEENYLSLIECRKWFPNVHHYPLLCNPLNTKQHSHGTWEKTDVSLGLILS